MGQSTEMISKEIKLNDTLLMQYMKNLQVTYNVDYSSTNILICVTWKINF